MAAHAPQGARGPGARTHCVRGVLSALELLVVSMGMISIGAVVATVALTAYRGLTILTLRSMVTSDLRVAMEAAGRDISAASGVPASWGGYTTTTTSLVLELPALGPTASGTDHVIYQCGSGACTAASPGQLARIVDTSTSVNSQRISGTRVLASGVTSLAFDTTTATGRVHVLLEVTRRLQGFEFHAQLGDLFNLRNPS